jgi:tetratricopeptide (TPR) repeat protein
MEEMMGANWLNKLGVIILVIGVALFLAYQLKTLGLAGKILVGYVVSAALLGAGLLFEKREPYRILARADSLAASGDPSKAVREFKSWMIDHPQHSALAEREVELAGLMLVARDQGGAAATVGQLRTVFGGAWPPEFSGRIGWWNYKAASYSTAFDYLTRATQQLPGDVTFSTELGWVLIEQRNFEDALGRFGAVRRNLPMRTKSRSPGPRFGAESQMGWAVTYWLARQPDEALNEFSRAIDLQPEWLNPQWTRTLYSPTVAKAVAEMQAEKKLRTPQHLPQEAVK